MQPRTTRARIKGGKACVVLRLEQRTIIKRQFAHGAAECRIDLCISQRRARQFLPVLGNHSHPDRALMRRNIDARGNPTGRHRQIDMSLKRKRLVHVHLDR
jgi:hypothetical protein